MKEKYRVGIISDTHGLLREEVINTLKTCDYIIHGGDINKKEIIDELKKIAPIFVVRGNNDKGEWAEDLPRELYFNIGEINFYMIHNIKEISNSLKNIDVIVFGHSHKYFYEVIDNTTYLNPGSCGKRRFDQEITFAMMEVNGKDIHVEKIRIPHGEKK